MILGQVFASIATWRRGWKGRRRGKSLPGSKCSLKWPSRQFELVLAFGYMSCSEDDNNQSKLAKNLAKDSTVRITTIFVQIAVCSLMGCVILGKVF